MDGATASVAGERRTAALDLTSDARLGRFVVVDPERGVQLADDRPHAETSRFHPRVKLELACRVDASPESLEISTRDVEVLLGLPERTQLARDSVGTETIDVHSYCEKRGDCNGKRIS